MAGFAQRVWASIKAPFISEKLSGRGLQRGATIVRERPLYEQFQRIGGGIGPREVSYILQCADSGQPARLIDLANESRQKDGHLQGILFTRDLAVSLCDVNFLEPPDPTAQDTAAIELCRRIVDEFENWPTLIEHLSSSYFAGHATSELQWRRAEDGLLLPWRAVPIHQRYFIFATADGQLRYADREGDIVGIDLLERFPGRVVQVQRRINGDAPVREGLIRVLVWSALFRNWDLRDWLALGEIGWKPWRIGTYARGTSPEDIDRLVALLERIGSTGVGVIPEGTTLEVEWPKGSAGSVGTGTHRELFDTLGREMSKAVLGQTTTTEAGPNGDRASTETRDKVRLDIREADAIAVAAALRAHVFLPAVAMNIGNGARCPVPWFQTDESIDLLNYASAIEKLRKAGVRIPASWVWDEAGIPEPDEDEELVGDGEDDDDSQDGNGSGGKPSEDDAEDVGADD